MIPQSIFVLPIHFIKFFVKSLGFEQKHSYLSEGHNPDLHKWHSW